MSKQQATAGDKTATALTDQERDELVGWSPSWYRLPVHSEVEYQLRRALAGQENAIIIGPRGVGKSQTVRALIDRIHAQELDRSIGNRPATGPDLVLERQEKLPNYPRKIEYYETAQASGRKTAVRDLLRRLKGKVPPGALRLWTDTEFAERAVYQLGETGTHAVCIDEAQNINLANLEHLKIVYDLTKARDYPFGFVFVGEHKLRDNAVAAELLGQRFTSEIHFPRFEALTADLHLWHPHLGRLKAELKPKEWNGLSGRMTAAANGSFRRLVALLENMNALGLRMNRRVDVRVIELALDKLAAEV